MVLALVTGALPLEVLSTVIRDCLTAEIAARRYLLMRRLIKIAGFSNCFQVLMDVAPHSTRTDHQCWNVSLKATQELRCQGEVFLTLQGTVQGKDGPFAHHLKTKGTIYSLHTSQFAYLRNAFLCKELKTRRRLTRCRRLRSSSSFLCAPQRFLQRRCWTSQVVSHSADRT